MPATALRNEALNLFNTMSDSKLRTVIQFAKFISTQPDDADIPNVTSSNLSEFGSLRDKIHYVAPDFDEPLEDFAEYM
ncbi:MAG: DUF2281 domain-containing protein [Treponema sp.]|nr:DUF2281 domain-containing protein [Treponema sp.]